MPLYFVWVDLWPWSNFRGFFFFSFAFVRHGLTPADNREASELVKVKATALFGGHTHMLTHPHKFSYSGFTHSSTLRGNVLGQRKEQIWEAVLRCVFSFLCSHAHAYTSFPPASFIIVFSLCLSHTTCLTAPHKHTHSHQHTQWGDGLGRLWAALTGTMRLASVECGEICQSRADLQAKGSERTVSPADCIPPWELLKPRLGVHVLVGAVVQTGYAFHRIYPFTHPALWHGTVWFVFFSWSNQFRIIERNKEHTIWGILTAGLGVVAHVLASISVTDLSLTDDSKPLAVPGMLSAAGTDLRPPCREAKAEFPEGGIQNITSLKKADSITMKAWTYGSSWIIYFSCCMY